MRRIEPQQRIELRRIYARKLLNVISSQGFHSLKIQEMARIMNVSKATLYNYFSSKEDIIQEVANHYLDYIQEIDQMVLNDDLSFTYRFQKLFQQGVLSTIYASEAFLNDLKASFPQQYEEMMVARKKRLESIKTFYKKGMDEGIFHSLNASLIIMQDEVTFRRLVDPNFLTEEGLSIQQALYDYYKVKKVQLLQPNVLSKVNDEPIHEMIAYIIRKLSNTY
ncbi:TetR/AcrR family transcriptional regulator [Bacillus tianshenii]|nr:TetR/AcrR family transcriptional regulator [Bacillus tianshenii]